MLMAIFGVCSVCRKEIPVEGTLVRCTDYHADAKTILARSFLIAELDDFLRDYLERRSRRPKNENEALRDVIIAWEVGKMELKEGRARHHEGPHQGRP